LRIIGPPSATRETVFKNLVAQNLTPLFIDTMAPELWEAAVWHDIDPVGVIAQSWKETGGGTFKGAVRPGFYNTCGLKIRNLGILPEADGDKPLAHQMFPSWKIGAMAHVQHLCAYAGLTIESFELNVDPRWDWVAGKHRLENFEELGGKWAPSASYGTELVAMARKLQA